MKECYVHITSQQCPRKKRIVSHVKLSLHCLSCCCLAGLAFVQTRPNSSLKCLFHALMSICPLSKTTAFLVSQMIQQAVMKTSLNMLLPNEVLASIIISRGCRDRFQIMGIVFQQAWLNVHSKKRWKLVSSCPKLHRTQL